MPRKLSYAQLESLNHYHQKRSDILEVTATNLPDSVHRHRDSRDTYIWKAYRLAGPMGGYIVGIFRGFNNGSQTVIYVDTLDAADDAIRRSSAVGISSLDWGMADAVSKFNSARYELTHKAS